jgi:hypothetical protein
MRNQAALQRECRGRYPADSKGGRSFGEAQGHIMAMHRATFPRADAIIGRHNIGIQFMAQLVFRTADVLA